MLRIAIISPSVRRGRNSHKAALYIKAFIEEKTDAVVDMIDLLQYNFPLFDERLKFQEVPSRKMTEYAEKVKSADGVIIITPEYNGGYPASLKNAIDLLVSEWRRKPVAFIPVSDGSFAGSQVITSLQFVMWKLGALTVPQPLRIPNVDKTFDEKGVPYDRTGIDKRAISFIDGLLWHIKALKHAQD
ncbi:MAG: NAD(P)H-dependent oxidoreductase [Bacteroidales bacterium]|jgi:NAD(P)H-dependent FMN reductase|nr:NAD(P)H-dependent oxidoreductase [Bacteroidales bacterium]